MDGLEEEMQGVLEVLRVEIQSPAGRELSESFGVRGTPTFILLDGDGVEIWRQVGSLDAGTVRERVADIANLP